MFFSAFYYLIHIQSEPNPIITILKIRLLSMPPTLWISKFYEVSLSQLTFFSFSLHFPKLLFSPELPMTIQETAKTFLYTLPSGHG